MAARKTDTQPKWDILVVEDDSVTRNVLTRTLTELGHDVVAAEDGEVALEAAADRSFDLLITDIYMPHVSGLQVVAEIRASHPNMRVIAVSGGGRLGEHDLGLEAARGLGAQVVLNKPISLQELHQAIDKVMTSSEE